MRSGVRCGVQDGGRPTSLTIITEGLLDRIRTEFALDLEGVHGLSHWARVRENGLRLAEVSGADPILVELFALLHDVKRRSDTLDRRHGRRSARFARALQGSLLDLGDSDLEMLTYAIAYHSDGLTTAHITVQTCWDADRLDLGRVGIEPKACYLCTDAAKDPEIIAWAHERSLSHRKPWWAWYG